MQDVLGRLGRARSSGVSPRTDVEVIEDAPTLESTAGYGPAKDWGLQLRDDLKEWREGVLPWADVDRGMLLSGPPGTGKTTFAASLAKTCGVNLVATSMAKWQAKGHLGDMLKAMRADFADAKEDAPCILFIDEIDSVGNRAKFTHDYAEYSIQVVNSLLECIDGTDGREGVIVIGAANDPDRIDPAVRRAGRLDKHVVIPLPDANDRVAILKQHVRGELSLEDLEALKSLTSEFTGADLAQLARNARREARRANRSLTIDDLKMNLPKSVRLPDNYRESIAIHEAGHVVVGHLLGYGQFLGVTIISQITSSNQKNAGGASFQVEAYGFHHKQTYLDKIATGLAGIAAEKLKLQVFGDGASAGRTSDLSQATQMATYIEAQAGWGKTLLYSEVTNVDYEIALRMNPRLQEAVHKTLEEQFQRATAILEQNIDLVDLIATELLQTGYVGPDRLTEFIAAIENSRKPKRRRGVH